VKGESQLNMAIMRRNVMAAYGVNKYGINECGNKRNGSAWRMANISKISKSAMARIIGVIMKKSMKISAGVSAGENDWQWLAGAHQTAAYNGKNKRAKWRNK
jgi:hypothetical protein